MPTFTDNQHQALLQAARAAQRSAYAPYSHYQVGAAVLDEQGRIHAGCNVENAAYPVGNCAEPSAIAAMLAGGGKRIRRVYTTGPGKTPVTPCGGCRQRIGEFGPHATVHFATEDGGVRTTTLNALLPESFQLQP